MTLASSSISPSSLGSPPYPTLVSNQPPRLTGAQPCAVSLARPAPRRLLHHPGIPHPQQESVPDQLARAGDRADSPGKLRKLLHDLFIEVRHDPLDAAKLVLLEREDKARLE